MNTKEERVKKQGEKENPHAGHRARLRGQFQTRGLEGLPDHVALELLLFFAIPRIDTNEIAHRLLDQFGTLENVFNADEEQLVRVEGIGESAAVLLRLVAALARRCRMQRARRRIRYPNVDDAKEFFINYYYGKSREEVTAMLLDEGDALISFERFGEGEVGTSMLQPRKLAELALKKGAFSIILAHNHPGGTTEPSEEDIGITRRLLDSFINLDLLIKGHLVVAGDQAEDLIPVMYKTEYFQVKYVICGPDGKEVPYPGFEDIPETKPEEKPEKKSKKRKVPKEKTKE